MLQGKVIYNEQEQSGNYTFTNMDSFMTAGFEATFGEEAKLIAFVAITTIHKKHLKDANKLQTFKYIYPDSTEKTFFLVNFKNYCTFMLPSEYHR